MSLERLARELEVTASQTGDMAAAITVVLQDLGAPAPGQEKVRNAAVQRIIVALQAQDRIEQRCHNLAGAVRTMMLSETPINKRLFDEIWENLNLDELAIPEMSGIAHAQSDGDCELF